MLSHSRGRKPADPRDAQIAGLRRRAERAEAELEKAQRVIEVQGIVSALRVTTNATRRSM